MDFKQFIIKYSFVNSKFIEDFYSIIREDYIERFSDFLVDSEILRKWLKVKNRRIFNDTIKRSYILGIDYILVKQKKSTGSGGQNFEIITLTPIAAKKICLSTKSHIGPQVQQYFIDLELALYKYKNYIIEGMNTKIKQLEYNQKPKINPKKGILYILQAVDDLGLYKIGKSIKFKRRLREYQADKGNDIRPLYTFEVDDVDNIESCVKRHMKEFQYRKYKEIYQVDINMIKNILKECESSYCRMQLIKKNKPIKKQDGGFNYFIAIFK